jgi:hypothetical protein
VSGTARSGAARGGASHGRSLTITGGIAVAAIAAIAAIAAVVAGIVVGPRVHARI